MNKVFLLGRLVKAPEMSYSKTGQGYVRFALAVPRDYTNKDGEKPTDFINCIIWGKSAECLVKFTGKGHRILVEGHLEISSYTDKEGIRHTSSTVFCNDFQFADSREKKQTASGMNMPFEEEIPF